MDFQQRPRAVLVIDDDHRVRSLVGEIVRLLGHEVLEACDGDSGLKYLEEGNFDMVITDLGMPRINGWEVAKWVKGRRPGVPVILVTGWGKELDEEKIAESGVDLVIGKPFQVNEIIDAVSRLLNAECGLRIAE